MAWRRAQDLQAAYIAVLEQRLVHAQLFARHLDCGVERSQVFFRFSLSFRDIEELMASRSIIVTYETIRQWTLKLGQRYANERKQPANPY